MSVEVVRAFVQLRKIASSHERIARILAKLETAVVSRLDRHDKEIEALFRLMTDLIEDGPEKNRIGTA